MFRLFLILVLGFPIGITFKDTVRNSVQLNLSKTQLF
jgi:hypothetical protein